jgi:hypothetical protein
MKDGVIGNIGICFKCGESKVLSILPCPCCDGKMSINACSGCVPLIDELGNLTVKQLTKKALKARRGSTKRTV